MSAFIVATVTIHDPDRFAEYGKRVAGLSERFGGESVMKGPVTEALEGDVVIGERVVVTRFPDADAARAYIASPEYQTARLHRGDAATVAMRLIAL